MPFFHFRFQNLCTFEKKFENIFFRIFINFIICLYNNRIKKYRKNDEI